MASQRRKQLIGTVLSNKMDKTVVVEVSRLVQHPMYGKVVRMYTKFVAHDEKKATKVGDKVQICQTRPISRTKRWRVVQVLTK